MQKIQARDVAKYVLLPGIGPRLNALFGGGFGYLAFLMASIYGMARLLPPNHPYLNPQNIGRFGMHHVILEAFSNLKFVRKHIDQIIIFGAVLMAVGLLFVQILFLIYFILVGAAQAQTPTGSLFTGSIFNTPDPTKDVALNLLDRVFGVPGMFCNTGGICTEVSTENGGIPWPMHTALHELFEFYSIAMLMVAVLIILYFVVVVVAETATTGSPFGQRFQNVWVPIRLVVAIGLLVPINYGYNTGQYLALYSAKLGSAIATNGWLRFNQVVASRMGDQANPAGEKKETLLAIPETPSTAGFVQAMSLIHACAYNAWLYSDNRTNYPDADAAYHQQSFPLVKPYFVKSPNQWMTNQAPRMEVTSGTSYIEALDFFENSNITIRFGEYSESKHGEELGKVEPICGEIMIPVNDVRYKGRADEVGGSDYMLRYYYNMVRDAWFDTGAFKQGAIRFSEINTSKSGRASRACDAAWPGIPSGTGCHEKPPTSEWKQAIVDNYKVGTEVAVKQAWQLYTQFTLDTQMTQDILNLGWGGSAIWYNKIAEVNGDYLAAVMATPSLQTYPYVMEEIRKIKAKNDSDYSQLEAFEPNLSVDGSPSKACKFVGDSSCEAASTLSRVYQFWMMDGADQSNPEKQVIQNSFRDAMGMILGLDGLLDIRGDNANIHPLAQLSMVGKSMVEHMIRNLAAANFSSFMGGVLSANNQQSKSAALADAAASFFSATAFLGMTAGLTLYYVLPFMPFVYFFFAVGSWVRGLFEAMVGIPLWALAHLRLDGEGLPGDSASNGYFLILEIGLRPILTVFGLIAALMIFTAQARILNFIWELVTENAAGYNPTDTAGNLGARPPPEEFGFKRDVIDQFFFTIIYTIILYLMANASFKLIDSIPNNILRWFGSSASAFSANDENTAGNMSQFVAQAGLIQGQQLTQGVQGATRSAGTAVGRTFGIGGRVGQQIPPGAQ